jgi:uncharacterized protein (DUF4415 family)
MNASKKDMNAISVDPDDAPELTDEWFESADLRHGEKLVRRGRPKLAAPNVPVSLRIPADVLEQWKTTGPGWQTRMVASLTSHAPKSGSR